MSNNYTIGQRISALRKKEGYTQEQLSAFLNITPQAVSKWESGNALPDITLLPILAELLKVSIDCLLTGRSFVERKSPYDREYEKEDYYWGLQHSLLAEHVVTYMHQGPDKKLLDIGSGEGRDAVYFSQNGFLVDALELSVPGANKIKHYSQAAGCKVEVIQADMIGYEIASMYDVIYSHGSLQFLPVAKRQQYFDKYKRCTKLGGINAHLIFVEKPFITAAPDWEKNEFFYVSGDLARYYYDWEILWCQEKIIECNSSGTPHRHAVNEIIARKI